MRARQARRRIVIPGLATCLLVTGGAVIARSPVTPGLCEIESIGESAVRSGDAGRASPSPAGGLFRVGGPRRALPFEDTIGVAFDRIEDMAAAPPRALAATDASIPWFRRTFVRFAFDGTCPAEAGDGPSGPERRAKVQAAPPELQRPATVQNLRRSDVR